VPSWWPHFADICRWEHKQERTRFACGPWNMSPTGAIVDSDWSTSTAHNRGGVRLTRAHPPPPPASQAQIAEYKIPSHFEITDDIAQTKSGKVLKMEMRKRAIALLKERAASGKKETPGELIPQDAYEHLLRF
jgi:hypothetical protein